MCELINRTKGLRINFSNYSTLFINQNLNRSIIHKTTVSLNQLLMILLSVCRLFCNRLIESFNYLNHSILIIPNCKSKWFCYAGIDSSNYSIIFKMNICNNIYIWWIIPYNNINGMYEIQSQTVFNPKRLANSMFNKIVLRKWLKGCLYFTCL